jgi:hypothetical protein
MITSIYSSTMSCNGTKVNGDPCSLRGSPRFGGKYCHHHCSEYYAGQRIKIEEQMRSQQDLIRNLENKLNGTNDSKALDGVKKALSIAHKDIFKSFGDLVNVMTKQGEVMCELVREQGEKTRETVLDVSDKQTKQIVLLGQMMVNLNDKVSSLGPVEDERRKFIEGKPSYDLNHPLVRKWTDVMKKVSFENMTEGDFNCYVEKFLDEEYAAGSSVRKIVRDHMHTEHSSCAHLFSDLLKECRRQAEYYRRSDLIDAIDRCLFEIDEPPRNAKRKNTQIHMIGDEGMSTAVSVKKQKLVD